MNEFVIVGAKVFDGEKDLGQVDVHVADGVIVSVGGRGSPASTSSTPPARPCCRA